MMFSPGDTGVFGGGDADGEFADNVGDDIVVLRQAGHGFVACHACA